MNNIKATYNRGVRIFPLKSARRAGECGASVPVAAVGHWHGTALSLDQRTTTSLWGHRRHRHHHRGGRGHRRRLVIVLA